MLDQTVTLDSLNKKILLELQSNCRLSYRLLGKKLGYSYKTIQKRIIKLINAKVIVDFIIRPAPALFGEEELMALIYTDDSVKENNLLDQLGAHPRIHFGHTNLNGPIRVFANFINTQELAEIGKYCRSQSGVVDVETHILLREPGCKCPLTHVDLQILQCLLQNPRMPVGKIAQKTNLTPRRIRNSLKKLLHPAGALPYHLIHGESFGNLGTKNACFTTETIFHINSANTNLTSSVCKIYHDDTKTSYFGITQWLQKQYPTEYWYSSASASTSVSFHLLTVEHIKTLGQILEHLKNTPHITQVESWIPLQRKNFSTPYPREQLEKLIQQAERSKSH